jgi:hypothetical protein
VLLYDHKTKTGDPIKTTRFVGEEIISHPCLSWQSP